MSWKNLKLGKKLGLGFGLVIVLLAGAGALAVWSLQSTAAEFNDLLDHDVAVAIGAGEIEALMLQCRRNEKDFVLRRDVKYLESLKSNCAALTDEAQTVAGLAEASGDEEGMRQAEEIVRLAGVYQSEFEKLVAAWQFKGLDHNSGLQGEFRAAAHALAEAMPEHEVNDLVIAMLQLRRYEKDFVRTGSDKYKKKFQDAIEAYRSLLAESRCETVSKGAQEAALEAYAKAAAAYLEAGANEEARDRAYEQIRASAHDIEEAITSVNVPGAETLLLTIRKHEKDYLLRGSEKYVAKTRQTLTELLQAFQNAGISDEHVQEAAEQIEAYRRAFDALVEEDAEITALTATLRAAVHEIEPIVEQIYHEATAREKETAQATSETAASWANTTIAVGIAALAVAVVLIVVLPRSITGPIATVAGVLKVVSEGDYTQKANVTRKDELGEMATSLNLAIDAIGQAHDEAQKLVGYLTDLPTPVMTIDKNYTVTFLNPAGATAAGSTPEECVGKKCYELFTNAHCHTENCRCAQAMQRDGIFTGETVVEVNNLNLPIRYTGAPIKDKDGQIIGAMEFVVDMTWR